MRKLNIIIGVFVLSIFLSGCLANNDGNKVKNIKITIYPETGYSGYLFSQNTYGEFLVFSENGHKEKKVLRAADKSFNNFDYKKGYKYTLKVKKIWLSNPPADGSSIRYDFLKILSKHKVITEDSKQKIEIEVAPEKVKLIPFSRDTIQNALFIQQKGTDNWRPLSGIKGFNFKEGYKYRLSVKKVIHANPYSVKYILLDILSKKKVKK